MSFRGVGADGVGGGWTEADASILRRMWADGHSARSIAEALGRTRNGVLGYIHRKRINESIGRKTAPPSVYRPERIVRPEPEPCVETVVLSPPPDRGEYTGPRPWLTRLTFECQFPVSGSGADTFSCCAPIKTLYGYCADHRKRMWQPKK